MYISLNKIKTIGRGWPGVYTLLILLFGSCEKFLDEKSNAKITTPTTLQDLQSILDHSENMNGKNIHYDEVSADDYFLPPSSLGAVGVKGIDAYVWRYVGNIFPNEWGHSYRSIHDSNVCLEVLLKIERTSQNGQQWDNIKGSALFFKAWRYAKLIWAYAPAYDRETAGTDLGIVLRKESDFNIASKRSSVEECYQTIIEDLELALDLLPERSLHVMRPSKVAVHALLARVYLSMQNYDRTLFHSQKCLELQSDLLDYNLISPSGNSTFQNFNQEVIFHADVASYGFFNILPTYSRIDTVFYDSYDPADLRRKLYYSPSNGYHYFVGSYSNPTFASTPLFMGLAIDEIYLNQAECLLRLGKRNDAISTIRLFMENRWDRSIPLPDYDQYTDEFLLESILSDRRKSLIFRGVRWMDIKRLNKEGHNIILSRKVDGEVYILEPNSERFALPLPEDVVALSGISQNPGW